MSMMDRMNKMDRVNWVLNIKGGEKRGESRQSYVEY